MLRVISLGWGVQSFTLAAMAAFGDLDPVDAVIHADTGYEASWTYIFAARNIPWLEKLGVRVVTVKDSKAVVFVSSRRGGKIYPPVYTASSDDGGQLHRQCTGHWKVAPIRRWLQANRNSDHVDMLLGISLDEAQRMRDSDVQYITNQYPLIERRMTRHDCINYLDRHNAPIPRKSSCWFCPYKGNSGWRDTRDYGNGDWDKAVELDRAIRKVRPPFDLYLHSSRKPLDEVDIRTPEEKGQLSLWSEECSGICGV